MTIHNSLALVLCLSATACGRASERPSPPAHEPAAVEAAHEDDEGIVEVDEAMLRDLRVTTREVESRAGGDLVVLLGELAVDQSAYAEVGTPAAARVTRLLVDTGDTVRKGQRVAELSSPELARARAEYVSAGSRVRLSEAALVRKRGLAAERIAPMREVQEAESAASEALAALRVVRAELAAFGVDPSTAEEGGDSASTFTLRSPVRGVVIERSAVMGQLLDPATPAFRIGDLSRLWLTVHAFERDAVRIRAGVPARLAFSALPGGDFTGTVAVVGRQVDRESRTVPIRIDVRNRTNVLRPGMSATATVSVGASSAAILTVPVTSVQRVSNEWCVFLPKDERHFEIRRIGRGRDLGAEVEVLSGLRAGEAIVVDGAFLLKAHAERGKAAHHDH
jgi:cobalt-zinc-cadmium efflux system membrane fusion protein